MTEKLLGELQRISKVAQQIRDQITDKVNYLKAEFRLVPLEIRMENKKIVAKLRELWDEENSEYIKNAKRETPLVRLERWKEWKKRYRLIALNRLTEKWYDRLWKLRSEASLITALYEFSEIEAIHNSSISNWYDDLDSLVLRLNGPRKPSKKKILMKDITYDIGDAFMDMVKPFEEWADKTKKAVDNLTGVRKKQTVDMKIAKYKVAYIAREHLTVLVQSIAQRTEGVTSDFQSI